MPPLDAARDVAVHIVAQVVKTEFVISTIGNVAGVIFLAAGIIHVGKNRSYGKAKVAENGAHPLGVAAGKVVVYGDDMDTLARNGVEVGRRHRH